MTTRHFSDRLSAWFGWCPMTGTIRMAPDVSSIVPAAAMPSGSGGNSGGMGRRRRGLGLAVGSIRIASEHAGFYVYAVLSAVCTPLFLLSIALAGDLLQGPSGILPAPGTLLWLAELAGSNLAGQYIGALLMLGVMYLAAGLAGSGPATFAGSFRSARERIGRLNGYILLCSLGMILPVVLRIMYPASPVMRSAGLALDCVMMMFAIATVFVVPIIAFEETDLAGAIRPSVALLGRQWPELSIGAVLGGVLAALVFLAFITGMVLPGATSDIRQGIMRDAPVMPGEWIVLSGFVIIVSAFLLPLMSIFLYGLYTSAPGGPLPPAYAPRAGGSGAGQGSRFVRGWLLVRGSTGLIRRNTAILTLSLLTALAVIVDNEGYRLLDPMAGSLTPQHFALAFCSNLAGHFAVTFLVAALFSAVALTVAGNVPSAGACLARSRQFLRPIAVWALVITIFQGGDAALRAVYPGMVSEASGTVMLVALYTMTIFIIPAILFDGDDVVRAIGHSSGIIRKTWPELAGGFAACTAVFVGLALAGVMPVFFINGPEADPGLFGEALFSLLYAGIFIVWEIFIVCIYLHATGRFSGTGAPMLPGGVGNGCC